MWNSKSLSVLKDKFDSLSIREQGSVIVGLLVLFALLLYLLVFSPMLKQTRSLEAAVKSRETDLVKLKALVSEHKAQKSRMMKSLRSDGGNPFDLFSFLDNTAAEGGLRDKIVNMKPGSLQLDDHRSEQWVEVKLRRITLKELTDYLHKIQSSRNGIYMKRLSARKDGEYLNLILLPAIIRNK